MGLSPTFSWPCRTVSAAPSTPPHSRSLCLSTLHVCLCLYVWARLCLCRCLKRANRCCYSFIPLSLRLTHLFHHLVSPLFLLRTQSVLHPPLPALLLCIVTDAVCVAWSGLSWVWRDQVLACLINWVSLYLPYTFLSLGISLAGVRWVSAHIDFSSPICILLPPVSSGVSALNPYQFLCWA